MNDSSAPVSLKPPLIVRLVGVCVARAWIVVAFLIILCIGMGYYVTRHFAMSTDTDALLSRKLSWRVRQAAFDAAFSRDNPDIVVVVDGQTPELSEAAAPGWLNVSALKRDGSTLSSGPTVDLSGSTTACSSPRPRT